MPSVEKSYKLINDPIYGHIRIGKDIVDFIDTRHFQRLRDLKQLGTSYYVFPGASHNRFEHSIGVSHLCEKWINKFRSEQPELKITERESFLVRAAGLVHDLGHGPFSHVFDSEFIPRSKGKNAKWSHEMGSIMMLNHLIEENNIDIEKEDIRFIENLITGKSPKQVIEDDRKFLFQIVANRESGVDVDKFDYLSRDTYQLGYKQHFDSDRLMEFSEIRNGQICFSAKEAYNLYEMFHTRYTLHKNIYSHRKAKAIEFMITDALLLADPVLNISDAIQNPEEYLNLTDCIVKTIETSKDDRLKGAKDIIYRLRKRQLYQFACETLLEDVPGLKATEQDICSCQAPGSNLMPDDIIIHDFTINYAMKEKNPVEQILFYDHKAEPFHMDKKDVSLLIPNNFQERYLRVFTRNPEKKEAARDAFLSWIKKNKISPTYSPSKVKRRPLDYANQK